VQEIFRISSLHSTCSFTLLLFSLVLNSVLFEFDLYIRSSCSAIVLFDILCNFDAKSSTEVSVAGCMATEALDELHIRATDDVTNLT